MTALYGGRRALVDFQVTPPLGSSMALGSTSNAGRLTRSYPVSNSRDGTGDVWCGFPSPKPLMLQFLQRRIIRLVGEQAMGYWDTCARLMSTIKIHSYSIP